MYNKDYDKGRYKVNEFSLSDWALVDSWHTDSDLSEFLPMLMYRHINFEVWEGNKLVTSTASKPELIH